MSMEQEPNGAPVNLCITPECGKERKWKGLCQSCYGVAKSLIEKNETTWQELADLGLVIEDVKPFAAAFRKKKSEASKIGRAHV